jgi:hypothetical protein
MFRKHFYLHVQEMMSEACDFCCELAPLLARRHFIESLFATQNKPLAAIQIGAKPMKLASLIIFLEGVCHLNKIA